MEKSADKRLPNHVVMYNEDKEEHEKIDAETAKRFSELLPLWDDFTPGKRKKILENMTQREHDYFIFANQVENCFLYHRPIVIDPYISIDIQTALAKLALPNKVRKYVEEQCRIMDASKHYIITREELKTFFKGKDIILVREDKISSEKGIRKFAYQIALSYLNYCWRGEDQNSDKINNEISEAEDLADSWVQENTTKGIIKTPEELQELLFKGKKSDSPAMKTYRKSCTGKVYW